MQRPFALLAALSLLLVTCSALRPVGLEDALPRRGAMASSGSSRRTLTALAGAPTMPKFRVGPLKELRVPSCKFQSVTGTCQPTHSFLLKGETEWANATFAGRAAAFLVAANAYCATFERNSSDCTYPCKDNGEICAASGGLAYATYTCPDSQAEQDMYCSLANEAGADICNTTAECVSVRSSSGRAPQCKAKFKAAFTVSQNMQYLADWGTTRRNVWGCCSGSNAKWINSVYCSQHSSDKDSCEARQGCQFNMDGSCSWSSDAWLDTNFEAGAPTTNNLKRTAKECAAIKDEAQCNSHRPVLIKRAIMSAILAFNLSTINQPVPESECVVWESEIGADPEAR